MSNGKATSPEKMPEKAPMLASNGMLPDGSNPEGVDPVPPLGWYSKSDLKDVILHGALTSPPTCKIKAYLKYGGISYEFKNTMAKAGSQHYKMFPVLDVAGRQVNDSYIIVKNLSQLLTGGYDNSWEKKITFQFQLSLEKAVLASPDANAFVKSFLPPLVSSTCGCCIAPILLTMVTGIVDKKIAKPEAKEVDITEFAKSFAALMRGTFINWDFVGGPVSPGQVDISFYGTIAPFYATKCGTVTKMLKDAGLEPWFQRMNKLIPLKDIVDI